MLNNETKEAYTKALILHEIEVLCPEEVVDEVYDRLYKTNDIKSIFDVTHLLILRAYNDVIRGKI